MSVQSRVPRDTVTPRWDLIHHLLLLGPKHSVFMDGKQIIAGDTV